MRLRSIVGSAALHAGVLGATLVAWSHTRDLPDESSQVIPVEMVDIAEVTNIAPQTREEPKPVEQPPEEAAPAPELEQHADADLQDALPPPPDELARADEPTPPPPTEKPHPQKPDTAFDPDRILALLDKRAPRTAPPAPAPRGPRNMRGIGAQDALTMDIQAALLEQMRECWNVPAGAPNPEQLVVQVEVYLTRDGHLAQAPQLSDESRAAMSGNPYMRAAAEAALRAISICEPYRLPPDRYDVWRDIVMTFDPNKMVGR